MVPFRPFHQPLVNHLSEHLARNTEKCNSPVVASISLITVFLKIGQITPLVQSVGNFSSCHTLQQRTHTARFTLSPPLFRTSETISSWPADFASFRRSIATITSTRVIFLSRAGFAAKKTDL